MVKSILSHPPNPHSTHNLLPRFLFFGILLFLFFIYLSSFFLINYWKKSLYQHFHQIYNSTLSMTDRWITDNETTLKTLANLPQFREKLIDELKYFQDPRLDIREKRNRIMEVGLPKDSVIPFPGRIPFPIQFISPLGIIISSPDPEKILQPFPYFNDLLNDLAPGKSSGLFTVIIQKEIHDSRIEPEPVLFLYNTVTQGENQILGYLVSEQKLNIITGRFPEQEAESEFNPNPNEIEIYTLYGRRDQYLIDKDGKPVSSILYREEYENALKSRGYSEPYYRFSLSDPLTDDSEKIGRGNTNIPLIKDLLSQSEGGFVQNKYSYRNYIHKRVYGGGFWIERINLGVIMEVNWQGVLYSSIEILTLILLILSLSFVIFLFLFLWIDRLRILSLDANPLTYLPGNKTINREIQSILDRKKSAAIIYGDLDNFKAFNDTYGFSMGDEVIKFTADVLVTVLRSIPGKDTFCGHIGGDDFLFIVPESTAWKTAEEIGKHFEAGIRQFYMEEHLKQGFIQEKNRDGKTQKFPIMSFSMAGIQVSQNSLSHFLEVASRCGEVKKISKKISGSSLVLDRRHNAETHPEGTLEDHYF